MSSLPPLPRGTDGFTPIRNWDESPLWRIWGKSNTYLGGPGAGKYIPKVLDYVEDEEFNITYQVTALSDVYIPTLKRVTPKPMASLDDEDVLVGQGKDTFRVWFDDSVFPYRLQVDGRCWVNGRDARFARIYKGNPLTGPEEIISLVLDQAGLELGTLIPLELSVMANGQNLAQYYVPNAYTRHTLKNGDFCWVTLFSAEGFVLSSRELRVVESSFIRGADNTVKAITNIALESPLMSPTVPGRLEIPLNLTLNSLNLTGVISYTSGKPKSLTVDGGKFKLNGLDVYIPSKPGQHFQGFLRYQLDADEVSYIGGGINPDRFVQVPIELMTVDVDNSITATLYCYPEWVSNVSGYRLRWFLSNLDRNMLYDVTGLVSFGEASPAYVPTLYGARQDLQVYINLNQVNGQFKTWNHPQTVSITLLKAGDATGTKWTVAFDPLQNPQYGLGVSAKVKFINQNLSQVKLDSGFTELEDWLDALYRKTKPIYNPDLEEQAPDPDHFVLMYKGTEVKYPIDQWDQLLEINRSFDPYSTLFVRFVKQGPVTDMVLSVAGMSIEDLPG